jgi:hypothetical protein
MLMKCGKVFLLCANTFLEVMKVMEVTYLYFYILTKKFKNVTKQKKLTKIR